MGINVSIFFHIAAIFCVEKILDGENNKIIWIESVFYKILAYSMLHQCVHTYRDYSWLSKNIETIVDLRGSLDLTKINDKIMFFAFTYKQ